MHTQDRALRRVNDRGRHQRAEYAAVGNGEVTAGQVVYGQLAVAAFHSQLFDVFLDVSHTQGIHITQNRGHQATRGRNRHADVKVVVVNHVIAVDRGVHFRVAFQRFNHRLHVEGHKAQTDTVTFFKRVTVLLTQVHDWLHVHFVEGGQHRGGVFRFQQTLGHTLTQASHRHAFFAACAQSRLRCRCCRRGFGFCFRRRFRQVLFDIFARQTSTHTGAFNGCRVQVVLSQQTTDRRAQCVVGLLFQRRLLALRWGRGFLIRLGAGLFARAVAFTQATQDLTRGDGGTFIFQHRVQNAIRRSRYFQYHFVSFDFYQHFIALNGIARFFVPGGDGRICYGFRQVGNKNIYATHYVSFN